VSSHGTPETGAGVQALIDRLHAEGVEAGRLEAARLVNEAREEAARWRERARVEAEALAARTRAELQVEREAAVAAIRLAYRDALLALKDELLHRFRDRLQRQLRDVALDVGFMQRVLAPLRLQGDAALDAAGMPTDREQEDLEQFAAATWAALLRDGAELRPAPNAAGLLLRWDGQGLELRFTDEAIAIWLLERLAPYLRRQLDGGPIAEAKAPEPVQPPP
jgi:V/A-type H+-transporting ATPase subunit E